jgi:hypothetical protein
MGNHALVFQELCSRLSKYSAVLYSVSFYLIVMLADWTTSLLNNHDPLVHESNPFVRNAAMNFVLHKGMVVDSVFFVGISLFAFFVFQAVKKLNFNLAQTLSSSVYIYYATDRLMTAVLTNVILHLHFYVAKPSVLNFLFR